MTQRQRYVLIGVGAGAVVALIALIALVALAGGGGRRVAKAVARSTTTAAPVTTADPNIPTTVDLRPVPTSTVTTAAPPPPVVVSTTMPPATTTTAVPPVVVTGQGAILRPPATADHRSGSPADCSTFADAGSWTATCGVVDAIGGELLWMVEKQPVAATTGWRAYVLRRVTTSRWDVVLTVKDDAGLAFTAVNVVVADVVGDGGREAVFGFHPLTPANLLAIDVVQPPGRVGFHELFPNGSVIPATAELNTWWSAPGETDYGHQVVRYLSGAWRIIATTRVPPPPPTSAL